MSEDDCNCASKCPDYAHCVCVYDIETGKCGYYCNDSVAGVTLTEPVFKLAMDSRVNLRMNGATLAEAGKLLADLTEVEIFVPASQLDEGRELYLMDVTLDTVVRELSLMAVVRS